MEAFLSHLATEDKVSGAIQRQALNALVFLCHEVMDVPRLSLFEADGIVLHIPPLSEHGVPLFLICLDRFSVPGLDGEQVAHELAHQRIYLDV